MVCHHIINHPRNAPGLTIRFISNQPIQEATHRPSFRKAADLELGVLAADSNLISVPHCHRTLSQFLHLCLVSCEDEQVFTLTDDLPSQTHCISIILIPDREAETWRKEVNVIVAERGQQL